MSYLFTFKCLNIDVLSLRKSCANIDVVITFWKFETNMIQLCSFQPRLHFTYYPNSITHNIFLNLGSNRDHTCASGSISFPPLVSVSSSVVYGSGVLISSRSTYWGRNLKAGRYLGSCCFCFVLSSHQSWGTEVYHSYSKEAMCRCPSQQPSPAASHQAEPSVTL